MKFVNRTQWMPVATVLSSALMLGTAALAQDYPPTAQEYPPYAQDYPQAGAQQNYPPPPSFAPQQLDNLVSRIALYPDPLLAQIFAAASFPDQIPDAARWANQYRNLRGNELADAIYRSNLPFEPAVQALLPFPDVLDMMARDMNWTSELGNAVLADRPQVMDAVQRMRRAAEQYGYLRSNEQVRVINSGPAVEIVPANPEVIYVPVYDPYVVYAPPRPGFFIGGAIRFGPSFSIGVFNGWGWGGGFNWYNHAVYVNRSVWGRTWYNRGGYVHNYGNWDGGAWRNRYYSNRVVINNNRTVYNNENRYNNSYQNRGGNLYQNRGGNSYQNQGGYYRGGQSAPVNQYRGYDRNNSYQQRNAYSAAPAAPVVENRNYGGSRNAYSAQQSAPAQNRSFERGNNYQFRGSYQNQGSSNRSQSAPVFNNRNSNSGSSYRSAPSGGQSRSFESHRGGGNDSGHGSGRGR